MKILIGINTLQSVSWAPYASHLGLVHHLKRKYPEWEFGLFTPYRCSIDRMRNESAKHAIAGGFDYLWFIDDDMIIHPDTLESLLQHDYDIVMELTYVRGYPFKIMAFKAGRTQSNDLVLTHFDDYKDYKDDKGLVPCYAVGNACTLYKVELLKKVSLPHFVTGENFTEDVYMCCKAKDEVENQTGVPVKIGMDTNHPTGHLLDPIAVFENNVEKLREFYKPEKEQLESEARELEYIERAVAGIK